MDEKQKAPIAEPPESGKTIVPERKLMLFVLKEAKDNLTNRNKKIRDSALAWFMEGPSDWLFSYYSICEHFDCDPERMRRNIFKEVGIK